MGSESAAIKSLCLMLKAGVKDFKRTAAFFPSSPALAADMVKTLALGRAKVVVELGAGTGVITAALLARMPQGARLLALELNASLAEFARAQIDDPRLEIICRGAEHLPEELAARGLRGADAVASSLGLTLLSERTRHRILRTVVAALNPKGAFTQFAYMHGAAVPCTRFEGSISSFPAEEFLRDYFEDVDRTWVFRNAPPAFVYTCRKPIK